MQRRDRTGMASTDCFPAEGEAASSRTVGLETKRGELMGSSARLGAAAPRPKMSTRRPVQNDPTCG